MPCRDAALFGQGCSENPVGRGKIVRVNDGYPLSSSAALVASTGLPERVAARVITNIVGYFERRPPGGARHAELQFYGRCPTPRSGDGSEPNSPSVPVAAPSFTERQLRRMGLRVRGSRHVWNRRIHRSPASCSRATSRACIGWNPDEATTRPGWRCRIEGRRASADPRGGCRDLRDKADTTALRGTVGIAHTRWAQMLAWPDQFCVTLRQARLHVIRFDNRDVGLSVT